MRDDLIGYVLGALDSAEQQDLDRRLEQDVALRREVMRAERLVRPLRVAGNDARSEPDPPPGLADRTCQAIFNLTGPPRSVSSDAGTEDRTTKEPIESPRFGSLELPNSVRKATPSVPSVRRFSGEQLRPAPVRSLASGAAGRPVIRSRDTLDFGGVARQWTFADFVVAAGVCVAAACLFFPAIVNSRYTAQMVACQNNQRELGQQMNQYAMLTGHYPSASATDNTAVAGIYSVLLREKGLLDDTRQLVCPAKGNSALVISLPSRQELLSAQGPKLVTYLNTMGGDFAYTMGYLRNGRLQPARNQGRRYMALLADAPLDNLRNTSLTNHVNGQNVLFEDGHVRFLATRIRPGSQSDDMFLNDHGREWAGQHPNDVVLGRSGVSPFPAMHPKAMLIPVQNARGSSGR